MKKLDKATVLPLFSTPVYVSNAKYYVNNVIDFNNINYDDFYWEQADIRLGDIGKVLVSKNQNLLMDENYSSIKEYCDFAVNDYAYNVLSVAQSVRLKLACSWMVIEYPGAMTSKHLHQNSIFSGVFFLKSNLNAGDLVLSHPLSMPTAFTSTISPELVHYDILNSKNFVHSAQDNDIIVFPSHVEHEVTKNMSNEIQCCIAFNYFFEGLISGENTERLSLILN